jgi:hypothetical protein
MPLTTAIDAAPMLTCIGTNDGYQFELMLRVGIDENPITKIRVGPFHFKDEYTPKPILGGLFMKGGPENCFWMHKSAPPGWSRVRWEVVYDEPDSSTYLTWTGNLAPGSIGVFKFISIYMPGGLRTGLTLFQGENETHYGVSGPNYEKFEKHQHE